MAVTTPQVISFARGVPAPECLAVDDLADCARTVIERDGRQLRGPRLPDPGGADDERRAPRADRGDRAAGERDALRGRPLRPDPLRGRIAPGALRPHRQGVDLQLVLLEDGGARPASRLV